MAAIKKSMFLSHLPYIENYLLFIKFIEAWYHTHSRVNIKCHLQMSTSMSSLKVNGHFEHEYDNHYIFGIFL